MAFNKEFIMYLIESLSNKQSKYTTSFQTKKKFSDVASYIREFKFMGKSLAGRVVADSDNGRIFRFEYHFGANKSVAGYYEIMIAHYNEVISEFQVTQMNSGAAYMTKKSIQEMEAKLPDFEGTAEPVKEQPKVDYTTKTFSELLEIMDAKIQEFAANANSSTFAEIIPVKEAMDVLVNKIPLAQRGAYNTPMSNLNMYISALKTQLSNPMIDASQFVGTYVPQMQSALAQLAALV